MHKYLFSYFILNIFVGVFLLCTSCKKEHLEDNTISRDAYNTHDISLSNWGPYTKKYIGVSHVPDPALGIRYDLSVFPTFFNEEAQAPDAFKRSNFHSWEASSDLSFFSFRHQLTWKDKVYADISYSEIDENSRLIKVDLVNNSTEQKDISVHLLSSIHFPPLGPYKPDIYIEKYQVQFPHNAVWIDGIKYLNYQYKSPGHRNELIYNGMLRGEIRENGLVNGSGIEFGKDKGDQVIYQFNIPEEINNPVLVFRYKSMDNKKAAVQVSINENIKVSADFKESKEFALNAIELGVLNSKKLKMKIESTTGAKILIDGFAIVNKEKMNEIIFTPVIWDPVPDSIESESGIILKYKNIDAYYGLYWDYLAYSKAEFNAMELPKDFNTFINNNSNDSNANFNSQRHFNDVVLQPIAVEPGKNKTLYAIVVSGTLEQVKNKLSNAATQDYEAIYLNVRKKLNQYQTVPAGEKYLFSQKRMAATTISNVVYPIYTQNQYIKHHTPGRKWDCLYTWDSGFIGIGLSQLDYQRGLETLNAYLNYPDEQSAFIHHGTPLPVQFYLFQELWNKSQSDSLVKSTYPKLKKYYHFLIGKAHSSNTRNLNSGLVRTWDYFYNSGGWDDYPPQKHVHEFKLTKEVTPVISTAHLIRASKILQQAALYLNLEKDYLEYREDINEMSMALNKNSWDEETGYYGYVVHNKNGNPQDILKYNDTINFNMGLDGISPIISGICDDVQQEKILHNLKTKGKIWSDIGLSTVDQSAPYFDKSGYWNGNVWMPHQWFIWKAMLDLGEGDFAHQIATTALNVWEKETSLTYNTSEYFKIETGRGSGWYQFSGLSAPVLSWFNAYYQIGNITSGYNVIILEKEFSEDYSETTANLWLLETSNRPTSVVVCLNPEYSYKVYWNNVEVDFKEINKGTLDITLPAVREMGELRIVKKIEN